MPQIVRRRFAIVVFLVGFIRPTYVHAQPPLFSPAAIPQGSPPPADASATRLRYVTIDVERIGNRDIVSAPSRTLLLNLFPDAIYEAVLDRVERIGGSLVWVGRIPNRESSSVTLSVENKIVYGRIAIGEVVYIVRFVKDGVHAISQIDPAAFPPERPPIGTP